MAVNGSRSVMQSGTSLTAESSVACLASPERGSTMPESTSEYSSAFMCGPVQFKEQRIQSLIH